MSDIPGPTSHRFKIDHANEADPRIRAMCTDCTYRGPWRRTITKVGEDAGDHRRAMLLEADSVANREAQS